jgi:hypothetical protein
MGIPSRQKGSVRAGSDPNARESLRSHGQAECVAPMRTPQWSLWESGIRRLRAFAIAERGALSPPDPRHPLTTRFEAYSQHGST